MNTQEERFQNIYAEFHPKILRYLRRMVGDADAEDVAQEVFVKVNRSLDGFRGESSLATWVYKIATHAATDRLRSSVSRERPAEDVGDGSDGAGDDGRPRLDTLLIRKDMNDCIREIIDGLPDQYRIALILSDIEGFSNAELGEVLGCSLDTVKIRLHRARKKLKAALEKHCTFYRDDRNELACDRKVPSLKFTKQ